MLFLLLGCKATKSEEIVEFLRALPDEQLVIPMAMSERVQVQPVLDGICLVDSVDGSYANKNIAKVCNIYSLHVLLSTIRVVQLNILVKIDF